MTTQPATTGSLSAGQREALAARLRKGRSAGSNAIARRPAGLSPLPLSFAQEQLWFIDQFHSLPTYNIPGVLRFSGDLDRAALTAALTGLIARHETLRTRLVLDRDGRSSQVIDEPSPVRLTEIDLSSAADPAGSLKELAEHEALQVFDLAQGPLLRLQLITLSPTEHAVLLCVHHTVFDGWSWGVFLAEFAQLYRAELEHTDAGLPDLPIQFADYAIWEQQRLKGAALDELISYWQQQLAGFETLQLPTDRPRPVLADHSGRIVRRVVDAPVLDRIRALAKQAGTTPFVVLLSALQALVHRYTGQTDVIIGTASANRTRPELAPLIGFLVNTLPIRADLAGDPTFAELMTATQRTSVAAYAHQDLPFAKLVDALKVERDPSRAPIFQVGMTYAEAAAPIELPGARLELELPDLLASKFDLNFFFEAKDGRLGIELSYPPALYDPPTVQRLLDHLAVLLDGAVTDPDQRLSELPLLTDAELYNEVYGWNNTAADYPVTGIHQQFEQAAERYPNEIAARLFSGIDELEHLDYAGLNAEANRVGRRLEQLGVGPGSLVGVCMQTSPRRLAVLLAIMKAGGGYVPLDPELPADRLAFMIADTAMPVVVTDAASAAGLPADGAATVLSVDAEWDRIVQLEPGNLDRELSPADVAYVIYTSGSTGTPKGVVVEHRHALNFLLGMIEHWKIGPADNVLQFASLNFDVSVMDMFMTLSSGATAILADRQTLMSPPRLADLMRQERVSFACLPPAVVNLLTGQDFPDLHVLLSAGEELSSELLKAWLRPGLHVYNGYGPTEAAIGACFGEMDGTIFPPPIGRPKPNYQVYVLDTYLNPLPVGLIGELHIGGAGVTRGYLNQPELTAQRFIEDPFTEGPFAPNDGGRLYKTGDLVKRLPDGNIAFVGRIDGQVKIRGLRVELGEIESAIAAFPGVAQSAVAVITDPAGQKQLAGYLRLDDPPAAFSVSELRTELALRLPAYMVPPNLLVLESFPLTHNGKIDKTALPAPESVAGDNYAAPATLIETVLVDTYATLLNLDRVGAEDSFFDVGGSSLQAMQLITRLRNDLAVDVDVPSVFLAPTPRQLAAVLREEYGLEDTELGAAGLDALLDAEV